MTERLYVIDFDRTLGRTVRIAEAFIAYIERDNPAAGRTLREHQHQIEASGGSFDLIAALEDQLGIQGLDERIEHFLEQPSDVSYLEDGAQEFLDYLKGGGYQVGILTYGGRQWQQAKLRVAGLDGYPYMILAEKGAKGALVTSWYDPNDQKYYPPMQFGGGEYDEVVLVDDKAIEFTDLLDAASARGYLFTGGEQSVARDIPQAVSDHLPVNIRTAATFDEIIQQEKQQR